MDLLKFDKRILSRNVKKGHITVQERDKFLESLPDMEGEYEIISIPLYDHEQPVEEEHVGTDVSPEAGANPEENFPPPSVPDAGITPPPPPRVVDEAPTQPSMPITGEIQEAEPTPSPIPAAEPARPFDDPSSPRIDESPAMPQGTTENTEEPITQSPPNLRPVDGFDDEGNPEGV